jgi:hypothetical protein
MYQGRYTRWNPVPEYDGKRMYCEAVHDDWEGFRIWLSPDPHARMLVVSFPSVLFYANSDEGKRLSKVENDEEMKFPHVFWKVENSSLVAELHRQSSGTTESLDITHYAFLSCSDCIDVLATEEPVFRGGASDA